jgi:hypothetical protein
VLPSSRDWQQTKQFSSQLPDRPPRQEMLCECMFSMLTPERDSLGSFALTVSQQTIAPAV